MEVSDFKVYKTENLKNFIFGIASFILSFFVVFHMPILLGISKIDQKPEGRARYRLQPQNRAYCSSFMAIVSFNGNTDHMGSLFIARYLN